MLEIMGRNLHVYHCFRKLSSTVSSWVYSTDTFAFNGDVWLEEMSRSIKEYQGKIQLRGSMAPCHINLTSSVISYIKADFAFFRASNLSFSYALKYIICESLSDMNIPYLNILCLSFGMCCVCCYLVAYQ